MMHMPNGRFLLTENHDLMISLPVRFNGMESLAYIHFYVNSNFIFIFIA